MSSVKKYNTTQSQWEYLSRGKPGLPGGVGSAAPGVPVGGTAGQLLSKIDGTTNNTTWTNNPIPTGGVAGQALLKTSNTGYDIQWYSPVPHGTIYQFGGTTAPTGYLLCQGQSVSTTTFATLFSVIGYTYGGSGANFTIPNLQGRIPVGRDGVQVEFDLLGETGGSKTHTLTEAQMSSHTHTTPNHSHTFSANVNDAGTHRHAFQDSYNQGTGTGGGPDSVFTGSQQRSGWGDTRYMYDAGNHSHTYSGTTSGASPTTNATGGSGGATQPHNNLQPYIALNYIIKA
jgi:microcystin-dependent protein